jgi:2-keto-4-pentenoate hydratase
MTAGLSDARIQAGMRRQFALLQQQERAGARRIGWKVGFGAPAAMEKLGIAAPLIGFLLDRAVLRSGATVSLSSWTKPAAEPEIAIEIGRDLTAGASDVEVAKAIVAIGPAIELADVDGPADDVEAILAGDIFQRHVIFGPRDTGRAGATLDGLVGQVIRSGRKVPVPADLEANTGALRVIVRQVAETLSAFDRQLHAGDLIIAGSVTPPQFLEAADNHFTWALHPIGDVSVNFAAAGQQG